MSLLTQGSIAFQEVERAMQSIGYRSDLDLLRRNYEYKDVIGREHKVRTIDLAGFGQSPPTYRNVCIGVFVSDVLTGAQQVAEHRSLAAPLVFEVNGDLINRWKITASGEPELKESIPYKNIVNAFQHNKADWEPERILRAKAVGESAGPTQLDFFDESLMPFLENRTFSHLDYLLREVLASTVKIYKRFTGKAPRFQELFPLAFRFIAAKVFRDRKYPGGWSSDDALTALRAVERYYNTPNEELPPSAIHDPQVLNDIWAVFLSLFYFPNLSEDDLALTFERTFITPEIRKRLGIHSTPPRVAEYLVHKLPFDEVPVDNRYVLEPFAGHGRFLVSAMRRMRDLLPTMSSAERHNYFVRHLTGIELDTFSVEVCRLSLLLADYPNRNGWHIHNENVFTTPRLQRALRRAQIVLCNPPFEDFTIKERKQYDDPQFLTQKPAELMRRVLAAPPALLGLVLPRIFESGASYRRFHRQLAETYSNIELVALPKVFHYSDIATMLVMASGRREYFSQVSVTCRRVNEGDQRTAFLLQGMEPPAARASIGVTEYLRPTFSLWIPPLTRIWEYLKHAPRLSSVVQETHRGVMWASSSGKSEKQQEDFISDTEKRGYAKGYARVQDNLNQFALRGTPQYLSLRPEDQYDSAYTYPWHLPKVVCNGARLQRAPWRFGAVADPIGLAFSQRFLALWPTKAVSIYALAGLLNSPLANAYFFALEEDRDNRLQTLKSLPLPPVVYLEAGSKIDTLSRELHRLCSRRQVEAENAMSMVLELDAAILRAYSLPPILERELLDTFQGVKRPIPFEFDGYYPEGFDAYIPLHELISPEFAEARADRILERLVPINDPVISEAMALLREEPIDDEGLPS
jgi:N-6 DNA Methylase